MHIMSLIYNKNQILQHLVDEHDRYISSSSRCIRFDIQAALISDQYRFKNESTPKLLKILEEFVDSDSAEEYFVYFYWISGTEHEVIDKVLPESAVKHKVRLTFEDTLDAVILPISPSNDHNPVSCIFTTWLILKIAWLLGHD